MFLQNVFANEMINFFKYKDIPYYLGGVLILTVALNFIFSQSNSYAIKENKIKKIYLAGHISKAHQIIIDNFNELEKGKYEIKTVNISFTKFSTDETKELFARFLRSESDKIDLFLIDQIWIPRFAKWCEPLEYYFPYNIRQTIIPAGLESCSYDENLVAIPLFLDIAMLYYRDDLLRYYTDYKTIKNKLNNSITWEDFIRLGLEVQKYGKPFYTFQGKAYEGLMCSFIELMASQNMTLYKNHKIQLNTVQARNALQLLVDLVNRYKLASSQVLGFEENQSYDYFIEDDGFFLRSWPNLGWHFKPDSLEKIKISNLKRAPTPHFSGQRKAAILGGWNLMVSNYSKNKAEAIEFIKYWISEKSQKIMYEVGGFLPVNKNLYNDTDFIAKHPELEFYKNIFQSGFHRPFLKNYTKISEIISNYINMAISNHLSVNDALKHAEEDINSEVIITH